MRYRVLYLAGPYSPTETRTTEENIRAAREVAVELWSVGYAVICPHLNTAGFEKDIPDMRPEEFVDGDLEIVRRCDALVLLPGWRQSEGTMRELRAALRNRMPVYWWDSREDRNSLLNKWRDPHGIFGKYGDN